MLPRMRTQSAGRPVAESRGGGTGERVGRDEKVRGPRGATGHPEVHQGLRHHSPTAQGAAVVAVPPSDRHHNGGKQEIGICISPTQRWWLIFHPQPTMAAAAAEKAAAVAAVVVGVSGVGWWQWGSGDEVAAMATVV
nr:hypothetical protein [Tanacetum cinerariifolium]